MRKRRAVRARHRMYFPLLYSPCSSLFFSFVIYILREALGRRRQRCPTMTSYASPGPNRDTRKGQYRCRFGNTATNGPSGRMYYNNKTDNTHEHGLLTLQGNSPVLP